MKVFRVSRLVLPFAFVSILLSGAIFGFFYAWVCSTMWGLDTLDPNTAIAAMNAMNISVRNAVFMPAFFLTPVVLIVTGGLAWLGGSRTPAALFAAAGVLYLIGAFVPTATINVPMNDALKLVETPMPLTQAQEIWDAYSPRWQQSNILRTCVSGTVLMLAAFALYMLPRRAA